MHVQEKVQLKILPSNVTLKTLLNADFIIIDHYILCETPLNIYIHSPNSSNIYQKTRHLLKKITICMSYSYVVLICVVAQVHSFFIARQTQQTYAWNNVFQKEQRNSKRVKRIIYNLFKCVLIFKCNSISF